MAYDPARHRRRSIRLPFYDYAVIHGDPHLGNYTASPEMRLNLLDFGCIRVFRPSLVQGVIDLYWALVRGDMALVGPRPLTAEEKRMTGSEGNIVIEQVRGAAAAAGLQPGDIIMGVNSERIESIRQLREAVEESPGNVALLVQRDQATIFVPVPTD